MPSSFSTATPKLVVTSRGPRAWRDCRSLVRRVLPEAGLRSTGFLSVFAVDAPGDPLELARAINREWRNSIGHTTAVLAEVESRQDAITEAAIGIARDHFARGESFRFRLLKRGAHWLIGHTPQLESDIGGRILEALKELHGVPPRVDLSSPDITIVAEVLGPLTEVGIIRKDWRQSDSAPDREVT
jgi:tRNA(Ser,Leu) C12 N-acetylase TAN1